MRTGIFKTNRRVTTEGMNSIILIIYIANVHTGYQENHVLCAQYMVLVLTLQIVLDAFFLTPSTQDMNQQEYSLHLQHIHQT